MLIRVRGRSMAPAFLPGELLWVRAASEIHRGDGVLIRLQDDPESTYLKRIVGLPGELITLRSGRVYVHGNLLPEPYVPASSLIEPKPDEEWSVGNENYIVLGDARDDSRDSRWFGPVRRAEIVGVVSRRVWPFSRWCRFGMLAAPLINLAGPVRAGTEEVPRPVNDSPWLWIVPGGGQFALGQTGRGVFYLSSTLSLVGWGIYEGYYQRRGDEVNAPLVYAQQVYIVSVYGAYRDFRLRVEGRPGARGPDPSTDWELASAPFQREQLTSPWVIGPAIVGAGLVLATSLTDKSTRGFREMSRFRYLGADVNRDQAVALHSAYWVPLSWGAGVSEEELFRGIFQSEAEDRWGNRNGLLFASALFGLAHMANRGNPRDVLVPALGGLYLGWRYQKTGYRLRQSIAAHVWYDIAVGMALFFADPKNNPLGAQVQFSL